MSTLLLAALLASPVLAQESDEDGESVGDSVEDSVEEPVPAEEPATVAVVDPFADTSAATSTAERPRFGVASGLKWTLFGTGAVLGVGGGVIAGMTLAEEAALDPDEDAEEIAELQPVTTAAFIVGGVGVAMALTAVALPLRRTSMTLSPTPLGLRLDGRF